MSGICAVWRKENPGQTAETLTAVAGGLSLATQERTGRLIDGAAAVAVSARFDTQQIYQNARVLLAADAQLFNEEELAGSVDGLKDIPKASRTAALLASLYERFGNDFVEKLRGSFSVILWDRRERKMLAAVDGFGINRLVYYSDGRVLLVATRIDALMRSGAIDPKINPRAIPNVLNFGANLGPETVFTNIPRLLPGNLLLASGQNTQVRKYWDMRYGTGSDTNESRLSRKLESVVEHAVASQCQDEDFGSLGAFLSGGTDSSTVVGMMSRLQRGLVKAFSIGFEEQPFNELEYAALAAQKFGAKHHTYLVSASDCFQALPLMVRSFDEPFGNSSAIPTYFCARLAAENGVGALLAGDGGDELFGGNERYATDRIFAVYHRFPEVLRQRLFEPLLAHAPIRGELMRRARSYVRRANLPGIERMMSFQFLVTHTPAEIFGDGFVEALGDYSVMDIPSRYYAEAPARDHLDRILYADVKITLGDSDLPKVTCMAELAGIQTRFPFLERTVAEFSCAIPAGLKVKGLQKRYLFKKAFGELLPKEIIAKKKHGFGIPVAPWLKSDPRLREWSHDVLLSRRSFERGYFRREFIEELFRKHEADDSTYYGDTLWSFFVLELWHRQFVRRAGRGSRRMKVVEIRSEAELRELKPAWEELLRNSASNTIFLTWEWATAWWGAYGKTRELRILAVYDDNQTLRGIAPLCRQTVKAYGQAVPALSLLGDGSNDSDYLDFIIAAGYEEQAMRAFQEHWQRDRGTVLLINEIPGTSPNLPLFQRAGAAPGSIFVESHVDCGTVRLPDTWDKYLAMLKPRFRTKVRSVLRDLEARPELRFGFCQTREEIERLLPILFDLHTRRWHRDGKPGVFGWNQKRDFYEALSIALLERGWLRFSWLEWSGRILACQYGFVYDGVYSQLQEGYEPASEHWNVGVGLRAWSIREFLKEGLREYDFLGGIGRHKTDWGAEVKRSHKIVLAADTYKNRLFCHGAEWETRARESARKILPQWMFTLRERRLKQRSQAALETGHAPASGKDWLRNAAANCYFHLKLPALARPLRDQYQVSVSRRGVSWNRRKEAMGRILYYHRVNDENDPFFPAISTKLFEQEMRYIARHYKVVSLGTMIDCLEGGSPEPVVAITFDDGYRDNYENAFPILQRYGLTGTIFLTTGSIDSGEPLWFEKLALAVKTTPREFIDLEIDIPRRFWMRTPAERLDTNDRIFKLLKDLDDSERRLRTEAVLNQLGPVDLAERRNKMLTWDEVRLMKKQGMDFGGHTVTHPFLAKVSREQVAWEAAECKRRIEAELQLPVDHFAYPNGREEDFGRWNKEIIRDAGYRAAVTTIWGTNDRATDPMELRRGGPWEETPELFAYKLDWYQLVNA